MFDHALPFWGGRGHDGAGRGAREHLNLDGTPAVVPYKRMRVQARQIYAFSHAAILGWTPGETLARDGYEFITAMGECPGGGWVRRLSPSGREVVDCSIDLYDQAFVLLALAWYARLTGEAAPLDRARRTAEWVRTNMVAPNGGYYNVLPSEPGPRQQNPHMHLLEAALALFETSGQAYYAHFAHELVGLFRTRWFDPATGTLGEFFTPDWMPAEGAAGTHVEPGHHFEWVWLLDQYERLTGAAAATERECLYHFAILFGTDPESALVRDIVTRDGQVRAASVRVWPQTEALKAHVAMLLRGRDTSALIAKVAKNLLTRFFVGSVPGAWIDRFDADGAPTSDTLPTSSFYHIFLAFSEMQRLVVSL
jgi:mannose-6-phosphate isomerase